MMTNKTYRMTNEQRTLAENNIDLVAFTVNKYLYSLPMEFDDMVSIGYYGLCRAAIGFDPNRNHTFSTYAVRAIIGAVHKEISRISRLKRGCAVQPISLNQTKWVNNKDEELINLIVDDSIDVENDAINKALCDSIWNMVPTYKELVDTGMTLAQYGKLKGISKAAACMRKNNELKKAKEYLSKCHLKGDVYA